jgi:hypothetical protein
MPSSYVAMGLLALFFFQAVLVSHASAQQQRYVFGFHPYFRQYNPNMNYRYRYGPPLFRPSMPQSTPPMIYRPGPRCYPTGAFDQYGNQRVICY